MRTIVYSIRIIALIALAAPTQLWAGPDFCILGSFREVAGRPFALRYGMSSQPSIADIRSRFARFGKISSKDNEFFIENMDRLAQEGALFFDVENIVLKELNDTILRDKDLGTAVTNLYKEILYRRVQRNPLLRSKLVGKYSDYKSVRFVFSDDTPILQAELKRLYDEAGREFAEVLWNSDVAPLFRGKRGFGGHPNQWHLAGMGESADQAGQAARAARNYYPVGGERHLLHIEDYEKFLSYRLKEMEKLRTRLQKNVGTASGVMVPSRYNSERLVLSEDSLDILRKIKADSAEVKDEYEALIRSVGYKDTDAVPLSDADRLERQAYLMVLEKKFKNRFGEDVNPVELLTIREYFTHIDGFMAGVFQKERVVIDLDEATNGIVSVDFASLGVRNMFETAEMISGKGVDDPFAAIQAARDAEKTVTLEMEHLKSVFASALPEDQGKTRKLQFSGDDGILMPSADYSQEHKRELMRRLGRGDYSNRFRVTFLPEHYAGTTMRVQDRAKLTVFSESVEKELRKRLEGQIPSFRLKNVIIAVDLEPLEAGGGRVNLIAYEKDGTTLEGHLVPLLKQILDEGPYQAGAVDVIKN